MVFKVLGIANNHSYNCLSSPEGNGPLQSYGHVAGLKQDLQSRGVSALFSGVFQSPDSEPPALMMQVGKGNVPVRFLSAYVGGDAQH